ncbi:MAG: tetratricopeptide repeat protein [Magnetococcales bacterium]|nr:tetratricopeptide repeat protein [Nitrospirota bacterium]
MICEEVAPDESDKNTLGHYLKSGLSLEQVLTWAIQFCRGMEYAFSRGVVPHRDIKPDNIMITSDKTLKITDFGLAGTWNDDDSLCKLNELAHEKKEGFTFIRKTVQGVVCGTLPWMAPEQFGGITDVRSDIYSFGIVMYQMVNGGILPFCAKTQAEWEDLHKTSQPSGIDSRLAPVIYKCLEKSPDRRYSGFGELRADIEDFWAGEFSETAIPSVPIITELEAWEHVNKGASLSTLGLIDEAIAQYREAIRIKPDYATAHNNLGNALSAKGLIDEAIAQYREAIRIKPDYADAYYNLGIALYANGLIDEAIAQYREAIRIKPDLADAYYNLGNALKAKGLIDEAITAYENFIRYAPPQYAGHVETAKAFIEELKHRR